MCRLPLVAVAAFFQFFPSERASERAGEYFARREAYVSHTPARPRFSEDSIERPTLSHANNTYNGQGVMYNYAKGKAP